MTPSSETTKPRRTFAKQVLIIVLGVGALIGVETVDAENGDGNWVRLESHFRFALLKTQSPSERADFPKYASVRMSRWYCYGLWHHTKIQSHRSAP